MSLKAAVSVFRLTVCAVSFYIFFRFLFPMIRCVRKGDVFPHYLFCL